MQHIRKAQLLSFLMVLVMVAGAVGLRQSASTAEWAPLFDIAALLGVFALSFTWETEGRARS